MNAFQKAIIILQDSPAFWSVSFPDPKIGEMGSLTILDYDNKKGIVLHFSPNGEFSDITFKD